MWNADQQQQFQKLIKLNKASKAKKIAENKFVTEEEYNDFVRFAIPILKSGFVFLTNGKVDSDIYRY